jgi:hypothetical protein
MLRVPEAWSHGTGSLLVSIPFVVGANSDYATE